MSCRHARSATSRACRGSLCSKWVVEQRRRLAFHLRLGSLSGGVLAERRGHGNCHLEFELRRGPGEGRSRPRRCPEPRMFLLFRSRRLAGLATRAGLTPDGAPRTGATGYSTST